MPNILPSHCTTSLLFMSSVRLCLWNWKPHGNELCIPLFIARLDAQNPRQLLSTHSALQLAVEHLPE